MNGVEALGLYTLTLGGTDASSLEISSKGYLRLKDDVKLDYETDANKKLDFTIKAVNSSSEEVTTTFSITINDVTETVGSAIDMSGIEGILLDPGSGIQLIPGGDIEIPDSQVDISTLGITMDLGENVEIMNSSQDEDLKELLNQEKTKDLQEEEITESSTSLESMVIVDDVIDEDEFLYSVDII